MSVVQLADLKAHLNVTVNTDDVLIQGKIDAAESWIAAYVGEEWPPADPVADALKEAIRQLAAHLYENREASLVGITAQQLPFGLLDLLAPYRAWAFYDMASAQLERLQKRLEAIPKRVIEAVQPALEKSGQELVTAMKTLAEPSRDTGALIDSIQMTTAGNMTPPYSQPGGSQVVPPNAVMVTAGNAQVRYPHLIEYGWSKAQAEPFFWPAYRLLKRKLNTRLKRSISKAVRDGWQQK